MTQVFFDTEFTGLHKNTTLISIGLISECGKTFYAELTDYDKTQIDEWLQTNVLDNLLLNDIESRYSGNYDSLILKCDLKTLELILREWFNQFEQVEIWSDCLSYDWVLFNNIFGHAFNIPKNVYYIPFDLSSLLKIYGYDPDLDRKLFSGLKNEINHNALSDAKIIKACYDKIYKIKNENVYYVYGYYDEIGNPFYIGKGKNNRMFYHLYESQNKRKDKTVYNKHKTNKIKSIIDKIGIDNFIENNIKIIINNLTETDALDKEKELILKYGKIIDNTGILTNITDGGDFNIGNHFKTKDHRDKISKTLQGHKRTEESKNKQSKTVSGEGNVNFGKKRSDDVRNAISKGNSKKIIYKGVEYSSITQCAKTFGVSRTTIYRWIERDLNIQ